MNIVAHTYRFVVGADTHARSHALLILAMPHGEVVDGGESRPRAQGCDRRLNKALHMAVIVRMTHDPETKTYVERRLSDGRTRREIRRVLKRYLARQIHRALAAES